MGQPEASIPEAELSFRVLGPLAVERDGEQLALGGSRPRVVLAYLVLNAGTVVPAERMVADIWGDDAPSTGTGPLRTYVSQLRRALAPASKGEGAPLVGRPPGYLLDVVGERVDAAVFEQRFAEARAAAASKAPERALARLDEALALWRGPALGDLAAERVLQAEAERLDQLRLSAQELRADLLLQTGQHALAVPELGVLAEANPLQERLWELLMLALYRCGRQADALRTYQQARAQLSDDVGIDPGPALRELESKVLAQDPELDWRPPPSPPEPVVPAPGPRPVPSEVDDNLPRPLTSFVGRSAEREAVAEALEASRLVTLCGSGGCGKTRLAVAVAEDVRDRFPGGAWFVDLAAVTDPALVAKAVAEPLGAEPEGDEMAQLSAAIGTRPTLLVLDNCEHLLGRVAEVVGDLLARCSGAHVLATSRDELPVAAGVVRRVGALSLPDAGGHETAALLRSEAVQLFVERGRSALDRFAPTGEALELVGQVCVRLDGIPLAIELAAALVGYLPLREIADRLDDRFPLLASTSWVGAPDRQRTLEAALDWSFDLLGEAERDLFVRLGVFVGDFTLTAAERVGGPSDDPLAVVRTLGRLVRASMVTCVAGSDGADRYRLLETMRDYARRRMEGLADVHEVRRRHASHYADFAVEAERHVHGAAAPEWLASVASDLPNLRAAMAWAFATGDVETGLRLAGSLRWLFARMGLLDEPVRWLELALARPDLSDRQRLTALTAATTIAFMRGEFSRTGELGERSVALARQVGDPHLLAIALVDRGCAAVYEGDLARAEECFTEGGDRLHDLGDRWGRAWMLTFWAVGSRRAGDMVRSRAQAEESLAIFRRLGDGHGQVLALVDLALLDQAEGRMDAALEPAGEAIWLAVDLRDRQLQHTALCVLGRIEQAHGHAEAARELLVRSIHLFRGAHHQVMVALAVEGLAGLAADLGRHQDAAALLGVAAALRDRLHIPASDRRSAELAAQVEALHRAIGPDATGAAMARGAALGLEESFGLAVAATADLAVEKPLADLIAGRR